MILTVEITRSIPVRKMDPRFYAQLLRTVRKAGGVRSRCEGRLVDVPAPLTAGQQQEQVCRFRLFSLEEGGGERGRSSAGNH